ncbi:MAG: hypothetical protein EPO07_01090 [Verrucomicrobia bacterium]|nr:MAG: hypothetical protein EPO07_01090 [Verrucomicrobiota bacterium]
MKIITFQRNHFCRRIRFARVALLTIAMTTLSAGLTAARAAGTGPTLQLLSEFPASSSGPNEPYGRLVQGTNGDFYGTTKSGGVSGKGTVFKVTSDGNWTTLFSFSGTNGAAPYYGGLLRASDGNFYGNTYSGGTNGYGTIFKITHAGVFSNLFLFRNTNGNSPRGWLAQGSDGNLYGTTYGGGSNSLGTVFKMTTAGALTTLVSFNGTNGSNPSAGLVSGGDGNFYGTSLSGGSNDLGTVFRITTNGALTTLAVFTGTSGSFPGESPLGGLVRGSDGLLYGTTEYGGTSDDGTIFRITTNGVFTSLFSFSHTNGFDPEAGLVEGLDGRFYGTTYDYPGGLATNQNGTVFAITPGGAFEMVYAFDYTNGPNPSADLTLGRDGNLYGSTVIGGSAGYGAIFRLVTPPLITQLIKSNGNVTLNWTSFTNGIYQVEYKSTINATSWTPLAPTVTATNNSAAKTDTPAGSQRFYRVTLLP